MDDLEALAARPARRRDLARPRPGAQPRRAGARVGGARAAPASRSTATTSTSSPTARCRTRTRPPCRRSSRTSRPATSRGTTTCGGWVWTTFNDYQWDLNWSNPDVFVEFLDIILDLANHGVEVPAAGRHRLHLEADGHQLPEPARGARPHPGAARGAPDRRPRRRFKAEAIVGPKDLVAYLGVGEHYGKVSRHRLPQLADGADLVDAGHARHDSAASRRSADSRPSRPPPPGPPTCAATTTSAGPSTTSMPPPRA